jgi:hypothetical protein
LGSADCVGRLIGKLDISRGSNGLMISDLQDATCPHVRAIDDFWRGMPIIGTMTGESMASNYQLHTDDGARRNFRRGTENASCGEVEVFVLTTKGGIEMH